ncbi:MAG: Asp-tRNA(Asn)/Glu-tRNA(Gln) amidotransferase subunit GatA [Campylobacteraceae bacterium]|nr:Asp-tRNA(Asn)/Glu-tRNA(Gln) amidotransferase subunit GatA [Campylobacteraceae bacterium]
MISLKEALKLPESEIANLRADLKEKIKASKEIGAYVEQLTSSELNESGTGVPVAIKDNISVNGWELTCSSNILKGYVAPYDATIIEKLKNAGLSPFGRTNMDEFAMGGTTATSAYGKTLNPLDSSRVPGGSSGGSAAAVGAGLAVAALGSDTGGSIRQPAAFCGCVGFKPSYGTVSRYGVGAYASSLDQVGPITQNVEDAAILYDIIKGHDAKDSTSYNGEYKPTNLDANRKFKIAVIKNYIELCDEDVKNALLNLVEKLKSAGHEIVYKELMNPMYSVAAYHVIANAEASANLSRFDGVRYGQRAECKNLDELYVKTRSQGFGDEVQKRLFLGSLFLSKGFYDKYFIKAHKAKEMIKNEYNGVFKEADLVLMPVTPSVSHKFDENVDSFKGDMFTIGANLAGLPAISVPISKNKDGLNISMQFLGKAFDDESVLNGALIVENLVKE